jgi:hypothetical protein
MLPFENVIPLEKVFARSVMGYDPETDTLVLGGEGMVEIDRR